MANDSDSPAPCWCGEANPYHAGPEFFASTCDSEGDVECLCGGDQCVCHWHGSAPCPGCIACDDDIWDEDDEEDDDGPF